MVRGQRKVTILGEFLSPVEISLGGGGQKNQGNKLRIMLVATALLGLGTLRYKSYKFSSIATDTILTVFIHSPSLSRSEG